MSTRVKSHVRIHNSGEPVIVKAHTRSISKKLHASGRSRSLSTTRVYNAALLHAIKKNPTRSALKAAELVTALGLSAAVAKRKTLLKLYTKLRESKSKNKEVWMKAVPTNLPID